MSEFSSYEKMPSSIKKLGLSAHDFTQLEKIKWVATEKVHGANFSFVYENGLLKFAKRKGYLAWNDDFFGFQLVVNTLENKIIKLFENLSTQIPGSKYIVYGELFGGAYPHPEVTKHPNLHAIQTGVYYSPDINFCAFDIAIENTTKTSKKYLDYKTAISYFETFGIFYAIPLQIGKLSEVVNFNTRINSTLPKQLKLPELAENLIEGIVIKPFDKLPDGITVRPVVKLKNKEFEEEKFHQAQKWNYIPNVSSKSEDLSYILEELRNYITQNRLQSAISKTGALDFSNEERITQIEIEFFRDAIFDFNENNQNLLDELEKDERNWIEERITSDIKKLMASKK